MKKVFAAAFFILFIAATVANWGAMTAGSKPSLPGLVLSLISVCILTVCVFLVGKGKVLPKVIFGLSCFLLLLSIVGLLISNDLIQADFIIPVIVPAFTFLYGLNLFIPIVYLYYVFIAYWLFCCILLAIKLFKKT